MVRVIVWEITEDFDYLSSQLHPRDLNEVGESFLENKKLETAATRLASANLMKSIGVNYEGIQKDEFGKPHIPNNPNIHVSISHAFPLAGAIIDTSGPTGIDIEKPGKQILRIKHKFLSDDEMDFCGDDQNLLTQAWCAKEVLYKIHGRKQLSFKKQLSVTFKTDQLIEGVITNGTNEKYELQSIFIKDYHIIFKH